MAGDMRLATSVCALLLAVAISAASPDVVFAQTGPTDSTQVVTSGVGQVTLSPDRAIVRAGVASTGARAPIASASTAAKVRVVIDSLAAFGFPRDSIRSVGWNVGPDYDRDSRRITGYIARATVQLTVRDLGTLGRVIDAVLGAGASALEGVTFQSDSAESGKRQALARAFADARAQAEALAVAAGGLLGRLILLSTEAGRDMVSVMPGALGIQQGYISATPISPEDIQVQATVYGRWELRLGPVR